MAVKGFVDDVSISAETLPELADLPPQAAGVCSANRPAACASTRTPTNVAPRDRRRGFRR
jgi:hypothetical protein